MKTKSIAALLIAATLVLGWVLFSSDEQVAGQLVEQAAEQGAEPSESSAQTFQLSNGMKVIVVGQDYTFGKNREGNGELF